MDQSSNAALHCQQPWHGRICQLTTHQATTQPAGAAMHTKQQCGTTLAAAIA
jgi:hypothetical protein